jgi:hypothetical protein
MGTNKPIEPTNKGLRRISVPEFVNVVDAETSKIYDNRNATINIPGYSRDNLDRTAYGYFTPSYVWLKSGIKLELIGRHLTPDIDFLRAQTDSFAPSRQFPTLIDPLHRQRAHIDLSETMADFLASNYNLTALIDNEPTVPIVASKDYEAPRVSDILDHPLQSYNDAEVEQIDKNQEAFPIFVGLTSRGLNTTSNDPSARSPILGRDKSLDYYNTTNANGFLRMPVGHYGRTFQELQTFSWDRELKLLPNQVKSLLIISNQVANSGQNPPTGEANVKQTVKSALLANPFSKPEAKAKTRYLFEIIDKLEFLKGFKEIPNANQSLGRTIRLPVWETLSQRDLSKFANKILLCRLRPYENNIFKVERDSNLDFPTFDEYFFIVGPQWRDGRPTRTATMGTVPSQGTFGIPTSAVNNTTAYQMTNQSINTLSSGGGLQGTTTLGQYNRPRGLQATAPARIADPAPSDRPGETGDGGSGGAGGMGSVGGGTY